MRSFAFFRKQPAVASPCQRGQATLEPAPAAFQERAAVLFCNKTAFLLSEVSLWRGKKKKKKVCTLLWSAYFGGRCRVPSAGGNEAGEGCRIETHLAAIHSLPWHQSVLMKNLVQLLRCFKLKCFLAHWSLSLCVNWVTTPLGTWISCKGEKKKQHIMRVHCNPFIMETVVSSTF